MCDAGSSPTSTVARPRSPSAPTSSATCARTFAARAAPSISVALLEGKLDPADVEAERFGEADTLLQILLEALDVARLHRTPDPGALPRPPHRVRGELRQQPVRRLDEATLRLLV